MPPLSKNKSDPEKQVRYLRLPQVLVRVGVSWVTLYRWEKKGIFPKRRLLGERAVGWRENEIDEWCANRPESNRTEGE